MMVADFRGMTLSACAMCLRSDHQSCRNFATFTSTASKSCFSSVSWPADCRIRRCSGVLQPSQSREKGVLMLYAILAYHVENEVMAWSAEEDTGLMDNLTHADGRLHKLGKHSA